MLSFLVNPTEEVAVAAPALSASEASHVSVSVHFVYQGFTQQGGRRCFIFHGIQERDPVTIFSIEVDLALLAKNQVLVQEGPMFCLQLLTTAFQAGPSYLEKFQKYQIVGDDFRSLLVEREKRAAEKALKKHPRRLIRTPPPVSNLWGLGRPSGVAK